MQQDATECASARNMKHLAMLEVVDQQFLDGALVLFGYKGN